MPDGAMTDEDADWRKLPRISGELPVLMVGEPRCKPEDWAGANTAFVDAALRERGALLIRGLNIASSKQFARALTTLFGEPLLDYVYRSTPRVGLKDNIYTATEYPRDQVIPQHNENAYANRWPMRIAFWCMLPSPVGGETPIADSRIIYENIPLDIRSEFERKGVRYVRNYSNVDLPWTEVFQTTSRAEVERYCRDNDLDYEWYGEDCLRTSQVNDAVQIHPITGERLWFNQAHLFHEASLPNGVREGLLASLGRERLPRTALFGDGSPISGDVIDTIAEIYESRKLKFTWEQGDLLLLDNMLYTHGRMPFDGDRKVLVGMARPHRITKIT
jgi:alpha-ketoglutarate-dependent taurine dioxygenase